MLVNFFMGNDQQKPEDLDDELSGEQVKEESEIKTEDEVAALESEETKEPDQHLEKVVELEKNLASEKEARLRLLADFQNYKRRSEEEKLEFRSFTNKTMLQQIADVVDDYERALAHQQDVSQFKNTEFYKGMQIVKSKLKSILEENGLDEVEIKEGDKFDPDLMEALTASPVEDESKVNSVTEVHNNAYIYKDTQQVFRTAKVVIGKQKQ
jgi:molecular chaperone GrpE